MPPQPKPYSVVEGYTNLIRDDKTNAILNTNKNEYDNYIYLKSIKEEENARIVDIEKDLSGLRNDLDEIKSMLRSLLKWVQMI